MTGKRLLIVQARTGVCILITASILLLTACPAAASVPGNVGPGESKQHTHYVAQGTGALFVNLTWENPSVKLYLTIYDPDGNRVGDPQGPAGVKGAYNTRITRLINSPRSGTWRYYVDYGGGTARTRYCV